VAELLKDLLQLSKTLKIVPPSPRKAHSPHEFEVELEDKIQLKYQVHFETCLSLLNSLKQSTKGNQQLFLPKNFEMLFEIVLNLPLLSQKQSLLLALSNLLVTFRSTTGTNIIHYLQTSSFNFSHLLEKLFLICKDPHSSIFATVIWVVSNLVELNENDDSPINNLLLSTLDKLKERKSTDIMDILLLTLKVNQDQDIVLKAFKILYTILIEVVQSDSNPTT
jgi:hypothetical protein